jgi:putative transposase
MMQSRTAYHYVSTRPEQAALRMRIKEIAASRVRYGYRRIYILLRREGWLVNHKRVHRLYREEGLNLRNIKRNRRHMNALRKAQATRAQRMNECWTMDFVSDALFDGRRLRALTILDTFTRESLAIEVGKNLRGDDVVFALSRIAFERGKPEKIRCDNGSEAQGYRCCQFTYCSSTRLMRVWYPGPSFLKKARIVGSILI